MSPLAWNFIALAFNLFLFVWNMTREKYGLATLNGTCAFISAFAMVFWC
jgi:hypothetical protein